MKSRPATREEILSHFGGGRVRFESYVREVSDCRTESGVRHISHGNSMVRDVNGVPTVRRGGEDFELFADFYTPETGRPFVACPTIIKK